MDLKELKETTDIEAVVNYLGVPVSSHGINKFILCPRPEHEDKHATNCYFKSGWNHVFCQVCGKTVYGIDLIMYETGKNTREAIDTLYEINGVPNGYAHNGSNRNRGFRLTTKEADLIGIHLPNYIMLPVHYSDYPEKKPDDLKKGLSYSSDIDGYLIERRQRVNWRDFADEEQFKTIVRNACEATLKRYDDVEREFSAYDVNMPLFAEKRKKVKRILERVGENKK